MIWMPEEIELVLVEDDPMVMAVNAEFVTRVGGFKITGRATSGREAVELVKSLRPRLTVLDIYLPDLDGLQVLKRIRLEDLPTDVIMITAAHDADTIQELRRLGVVDYIIKPFKFQRIARALAQYREYTEKMASRCTLDQGDLDSLWCRKSGDECRPEENVLPKGLRQVTLRQILAFLAQEKREVSAEEVAEGIGLARVTARRYLEYLEKNGKVWLESRYGTIGRPLNKYRLTERNRG
ncbi:transcriptional regulatory protein CitT [Peptococcaceae bacterium CEB3]|nr:transcriptional regulatory protein CitT [Peptococcaceae bacterium CEB3]